jgi:hypothetical protein
MNKKSINSANKVEFRADTRIGNISAEHDDNFLFECFVDNPAVSTISDLQSPAMILSGRTGAGKTAILRYLLNKHTKSAEIDPASLSIQYISNSDVFQFLNDIGADLDIFFQIIWKHVLCISYIKLRYQIDDQKKYDTFLSKIFESFRNDVTKKRALDYIETWGNKFWISMDENVRSIAETYAHNITAELGVDVNAFKSKAGYGRNLSRDQKVEYARRARKIIDSQQLADLSRVLDLFAGQEKSVSGAYYLMIDRLDERWADDSIKFRLIRALIETLKSFKKIKNLKIIVALRNDVIERSIQENTDAGFQREKFEDFIVDIKWTEYELKKLINKRINKLFLWKYTKQNVTFEDVFVAKIPPNRQTFDYMLDRTQMRPRDIMAFVNKCFETAEGSTDVSAKQLLRAEQSYSNDRKAALLDEWRTAFPALRHCVDFLADGALTRSVGEISTRDFLERVALPICASQELSFDPLYQPAKEVIEAKEENIAMTLGFAKSVLALLYRVGAIAIKRDPEERYLYSYKDEAIVTPTSLGSETRIRAHPMLHRALGLTPRELGKWDN